MNRLTLNNECHSFGSREVLPDRPERRLALVGFLPDPVQLRAHLCESEFALAREDETNRSAVGVIEDAGLQESDGCLIERSVLKGGAGGRDGWSACDLALGVPL